MNAQLIVALDVPSSGQIPAIVDQLPSEVAWYKVGLEIFTAEGPSHLDYLRQKNEDIPRPQVP